MAWIVKSFFVTLAILFFWRVEKGAEACKCMTISPQQSICRSDVVIRATISGREDVYSGTLRTIKYNINPIQVFRGPKITAIYTSGPCRAYLDNAVGKDYLLTGKLGPDGVAHIIMCNFEKPWNELSDNERRLIENLDHNCG